MIKADAVDLSQVYTLVDSILPFEACLYYQVLPLFIQGSRLTIGIVDIADPAATEYVKKQLSYINYSIDFQTIASDWHRDLLSKYLNHTAKKRQEGKEPEAQPAVKAVMRSPQTGPEPRNLQQTFIVDQPDEIFEPEWSSRHVITEIEHTLELEPPIEPPSPEVVADPNHRTQAAVTPATAAPRPTWRAARLPNSQPSRVESPLRLELAHQYRDVAPPQLLTLPPPELMQALLGKVINEGIGRLYFERREAHAARILWSRDGILQAVVDPIDDQVFQAVINEFKRLTHVSLISVRHTKQVEIERTFEGQRILLRFRVMPGAHGEEATLQILRGTALRFYQQQQIDRLGRDALDAAQLLQHRLGEIRDRARNALSSKPTRSETLPALITLLKQMEAQVEEILATYDFHELEAVLENPAALNDEIASV